jgi:hypothetical protein
MRAWLVLAALLALPGVARAYPQWQFTSGSTRCNVCHFAPAGGGLHNAHGRDATGDELSTLSGNGDLLHGTMPLPSWLALGGDLRGAYATRDVQDPNGPTSAFFPMQADLHVRVDFNHGLSAYAIGGLRGQVRANRPIVPTQNYQPIYTSRLVSREHWAMYQPAPQGWYARAGRFFAPFGLRLAEHVTYGRRDLGFNHLEESYNASGGYLANLWELHLTAFAPDFFRHIGGQDAGLAAYYERRVLDETGAIALQARHGAGQGVQRTVAGVVGKYHIEPLHTLLLTEVNGIHVTLPTLAGRNQLMGALGVVVLPVRGVVVTLLGERFHEDVKVSGAAWNAGSLFLNWFPYPHVELQIMGRLDAPLGTPVTRTLFLQLHYYL